MTRDGDDESGLCVSVVGVVRAVCRVCVCGNGSRVRVLRAHMPDMLWGVRCEVRCDQSVDQVFGIWHAIALDAAWREAWSRRRCV
jgi:hypothetical protein